MVSVSYQLLFEKSELKDPKMILNDALDNITIEIDKTIFEECIQSQYSKDIGEKMIFLCFKIDLDEELDEDLNDDLIDEVISSFNDELKSNEIEAIFKYYDNDLGNELKKYHSKIFEIEMKIREVISFILIDTYGNDFYDLFKEINIGKFQYPKKRMVKVEYEQNVLKSNESMRKDYLSTFFENESFYLNFGQYQKLLQTKTLQQGDLFKIARFSNTYEDFQKNIVDRGIKEDLYIEFLEDVKLLLDDIEPLRNCIAHNRTLTESESGKLTDIHKELNKKIEVFNNALEKEGILKIYS
ncbi:hypothetical protein [Methanobacterium formicicum]|uniref:Uncharacterized protein n=1 Tax=Methanobacterium formicicum (strain DSM 3637 / PP1) TaxID=1204725 RepID=K2R6Q5_METFP|nr:hypothetical protein [Methanobacterium formicicum]EKF86842.1 hypothetical protein A994_01110 [Methanobacterium formicicum DSM 3637]